MTQIEFIYNLDSYEEGLSLILDKRYKNQKTMIFCDNAKKSHELSDSLWKQSGFYPNIIWSEQLSSNHVPSEDFLIGDQFNKNFDELLINASGQECLFFSRYEKTVELVLTSDNEKNSARDRLKKYKERGYEVKLIDAIN
ncbi:MAG: DNA polymerase III subunit chi [Betaproteobacteria bacterium]|nr:DNA polymerase III subunit chi [Betaproteobacteria bacterium]